MIYSQEYDVAKDDFVAAGEVSAGIKSKLKKMGVDPDADPENRDSRCYEAEINMIIHSYRRADDVEYRRRCESRSYARTSDRAYPDIELAMKEGYSTASDTVREMGFGAGMGLLEHQQEQRPYATSSRARLGQS